MYISLFDYLFVNLFMKCMYAHAYACTYVCTHTYMCNDSHIHFSTGTLHPHRWRVQASATNPPESADALSRDSPFRQHSASLNQPSMQAGQTIPDHSIHVYTCNYVYQHFVLFILASISIFTFIFKPTSTLTFICTSFANWTWVLLLLSKCARFLTTLVLFASRH